jgi:hypothetical protein
LAPLICRKIAGAAPGRGSPHRFGGRRHDQGRAACGRGERDTRERLQLGRHVYDRRSAIYRPQPAWCAARAGAPASQRRRPGSADAGLLGGDRRLCDLPLDPQGGGLHDQGEREHPVPAGAMETGAGRVAWKAVRGGRKQGCFASWRGSGPLGLHRPETSPAGVLAAALAAALPC